MFGGKGARQTELECRVPNMRVTYAGVPHVEAAGHIHDLSVERV